MTSSREQLHEWLARLKLRGIDAALEAELDQAEREAAPPAEVLARLLVAEDAHRREKSLAYRVRQARLPWQWTLQSFPFDRQPGIDRAQIRSLAGLEFVRRHENLLLIGPPGTGKSGIAIGLLRQACLNGYAGRFYNAQALIDELYASLADRSTTRLIAQLARHRPLLIDELGYLTLKPEQSNAFFRLMDQRYGRASTIITTNLEPGAWYELFQNKALVDAMLDRLQHHCITIRIQGPSLRAPQPQPSDASTPPPADPVTRSSARSRARP
ncbi:MAG: IS21-like element helper ATPase IstB [Burkholderiaceae bacterium]